MSTADRINFDMYFLLTLAHQQSFFDRILFVGNLVFDIQERPNDIEAYRLLGEVKYELKDFERSASAYKSALSVSTSFNSLTRPYLT